MAGQSPKALKIFYCYAREDKMLRDELGKHLKPLRRAGLIDDWCDQQIQAGKEWEKEIEHRLKEADVILLLVSPDFFNSDYCYTKEMQRALEMHKVGRTHVIPILLRPVTWERTPIAQLQVLPSGGKAVTSWQNPDEAFYDVAQGLFEVVKLFNPQLQRSTEQNMFTNPHDDSYVLSHIWSKLSPDLRDVLISAFNTSQQDTPNGPIRTRHVFDALQSTPNTAKPLITRLPQGVLPGSKKLVQIFKERDLLYTEPPLSSCVEESLKKRVEELDENEEITAFDLLIEILRTGTGSTVSRLRRAGITPSRVDELVRSLGVREE
jgi:DNA-binding transcriptional ArsR family regulator